MKRILLVAAMAMMGMTACQQAELSDATSDGEVQVLVTTTLPAEMSQTRAVGDGTQVNRCIMEIYLNDELYGSRQVAAVSNHEATFSTRLVAGQSYDLVFWADCANGTTPADFTDRHYTTTNLTDVTIADVNNYTGNDDTRDAFFGTVTVEANQTQAVSVTLKRPFGQLNVQTLDMAEVPATQQPTAVEVAFASVPTGINLLTGELTGKTGALAYSAPAALADNANNAGKLSFDYILAPQTEGEQYLMDFTMSFYGAGDTQVAADYAFSSIPVQRNYRTMVSGNLLTKGTDVNVTVDPAFGGEIGTSIWTGQVENPVIDEEAKTVTVNTAAQFAGLASLVNSGSTFEGYSVTLHSDLDLDNIEWTPVGTGKRSGSEPSGNSFKGTFDGNGNTISNLVITTTGDADEAIGFFGIVDGGTVKNLVFENVNIDVPTSEMAAAAVGMLTGGGQVSGVEVHGSISALRGNGAVVGRITKNGHVDDCRNYATVNGTGANVGGIVGAAYYTAEGETMTISNCENYGAITCTAGVVGGIVGLSAAEVSNCVNEATITGNGTDVAGIVAEQQNAGSVKDCINRGDIVNNSTAYGTGGIVGWIRYNGATSNYPAKNVITVSGNTNYGSIKGGNDAGGIVGTVYNLGIIEHNNNFAPTLSAATFAAGIVGNTQFTETAVGMSELDMVYVTDNCSTTTLDNMLNAYCCDLYVYVNNADKVTVLGNTDSAE